MSETVTYSLINPSPGWQGEPPILRLPDNAYIPQDPANRDFLAYQEWLAKGNKPIPAPPVPKVPEPEVPVSRAEFEELKAMLRKLAAR